MRGKDDCTIFEFSFSLIGDGTVEGGGGGKVVAELLQDSLVVFGVGIMDVMILSKLDARSVAQSCSVCRGWLGVASSDNIWAPKVPLHFCPFSSRNM
ncbi:hypothetical protein BUALT_Bualt14G0045400 [Buddleja alternifolia]|uniref:F-box domain-containing protein n=1 Tax=Buddleja alternifolia TaxID=168488 RepID=A0AAV6WN31_9LAMI|nr:hypothetical protein BUALT_Bualt14G0045400 [Buddleja alternifolia]